MEMQSQELRHVLGANVKRRRLELRLTQQQLAKKLKVSQPYLSDVENGKCSPMLETLAEFSDALEVPPSYLLSGTHTSAS